MADLFPRIFNREKLAAPGVSRTREEGWWQSLECGLAYGTGQHNPSLVRQCRQLTQKSKFRSGALAGGWEKEKMM